MFQVKKKKNLENLKEVINLGKYSFGDIRGEAKICLNMQHNILCIFLFTGSSSEEESGEEEESGSDTEQDGS